MKKRVLIIEDDLVSAKVVEKVCEKFGLAADICTNGAEGLFHLLSKGPYELIITDLMMPEVSGEVFLSVTESLIHRGLIKKTSVIIVSVVAEFSHLSKLSCYLCVDAILPKPVAKDTLAGHIENILKKNEEAHPIEH